MRGGGYKDESISDPETAAKALIALVTWALCKVGVEKIKKDSTSTRCKDKNELVRTASRTSSGGDLH